MKKILILLVSLVFLVGCGDKNENTVNTVKNNADMNVNINVSDNGKTTTVTTGDTTTSVSNKDSVDLPENYPVDVLPVYPGSFVMGASENADGSFVVMAMTNDSYEEIKNFYKEHLKASVKTMTSDSEENFLDTGTYMGYSYTVSISESLEELGYRFSYSLILMKSMDSMNFNDPSGTTEDTTNEEDMGVSQMVTEIYEGFPEAYPSKLLPISEEESFEVRAAMEVNGQQAIAYVSEVLYEDSVAYFESIMSKMEDYSTMALDNAQMIYGNLDGYNFTVVITKNTGDLGEPENFDSLIQIFY
ncbi:MAG: hypothetical protein JXR88_18660 [Clostridia bacterium]|nr:hypothetical protein [Clostridia bacterium]